MKGLFVIGTDTGVGKTVACAVLAACLRRRGVDAGYMKPVGSDGVEVNGRLVSPDALFVARTVGLDDPWPLLNPVCLPGALSPLAAGEAAGKFVDLSVIPPAWEALRARHELIIVEGVGGLLVPLNRDLLFTDLMARMPLPALVIGRPGLGTINHTLLTLEALQRRGFQVIGFGYSSAGEEPGDSSLPTNARHTGLFTEIPFWGRLPRVFLDGEGPGLEALVQAGRTWDGPLDRLVRDLRAT
ncbi:MAG: dethiobiotin synthase [Thermodesulfobacteriota bacterium]